MRLRCWSKSFVGENQNEASDCQAAGLTCMRGRAELGGQRWRGAGVDRESLWQSCRSENVSTTPTGSSRARMAQKESCTRQKRGVLPSARAQSLLGWGVGCQHRPEAGDTAWMPRGHQLTLPCSTPVPPHHTSFSLGDQRGAPHAHRSHRRNSHNVDASPRNEHQRFPPHCTCSLVLALLILFNFINSQTHLVEILLSALPILWVLILLNSKIHAISHR